ncbi:MAG: Response regulator of the LytR/AlgR family [Anaerocolumna sp.]|jgi:two-component system response regulator LytT|nr:Response regulator of the LytR/AlgR family [Anaerocolumna sp.]
MNQYRIAVCDDEAYYREEVINFITTYSNESGNVFDLHAYQSGEELLKANANTVYHIIILDVEMKGKTGIDIAREIRKYDENVIIIFATSHENYALGAFDVSAAGYLVKPVSYVKLKKLLSNAIMSVDFLRDRESAKERYIEIKVKYENIRIEVNKIKYIEKKRNVSIIHMEANEYTCYETLAQLYSKLDINKFCYIHQGYIVNFNMIMEVGKTMVVLADYIEIPISRKYYKDVKSRFMDNIYEKMNYTINW